MILHNEYAQHSVDWSLARSGIPTASEFDALVTPDFKIRTGEMPKSYLAKKVAEAWQGGPLASFNTFDMDIGAILEDEAKPWYALEFGQTIESVGFITTDDGRVGCSPDGLLTIAIPKDGQLPDFREETGGIEIKCPAAHTHVSYVLKGELPKDYTAQVHGSMFVTGCKWWKFLSYRRHFPPLILTVERDEEIMEKLHVALEDFLACFDSAMKRLEEINGGPPTHRVRRQPAPQPEPAPEQSEQGIIP